MANAFDALPKSLREKARTIRLGPGVPALLAHPDWKRPAPVVIWLHGRTANKELDPGRYSRWLRAGIAACSVDLPGHGERLEASRQEPAASLGVIEQAAGEIDDIVESLDPDLFDTDRMAIGGMSLGGMVSLRRLCARHPFVCAAVEGTTGDLERLYHPRPEDDAAPWPVAHDAADIARVNAAEHLAGFAPVPLLALHSEADSMVPWPGQRDFLERLREHYAAVGAKRSLVREHTWAETGAPFEHVGFGKVSNEAKNMQTDFLAGCLTPSPPAA